MKVAVLEAAGHGRRRGGDRRIPARLPQQRRRATRSACSSPRSSATCELERHGLKVVLRKTDNFLPGDGDYLLSGRGGLTRKEIARHVKADGEAYDRYIAELETVVRLLKKWLLRAPPNVGGRVSAIPKLLSLGRDMAGLSLAETRIVHDFAVRSAGEILDRHFEGDLTKALFGFDGVVGNFASPQSPGTGLRAAPPSVRRGGGRARRVGPCDRRHGLDHPGDGARLPRSGRRHRAQHAGRGNHRRSGGRAVGRRRRRQGLAGEDRCRRRQPEAAVRPAGAARARSTRTSQSRMHALEVRKRDLPHERRACPSCRSSPCCRRRAIT